MSSLTRDDEHKLKDYNRRVADDGIESLSEDDQLWYSLLRDRYDRFLEEGMRIMRAEAAKESGGGLFGFLGGSGGGNNSKSNNRSRMAAATTTNSTSTLGDAENSTASPNYREDTNKKVSIADVIANDLTPCDSAVDEADLLGSPYHSRHGSEAPLNNNSGDKSLMLPASPAPENNTPVDDATFQGTFGHPPPQIQGNEFPGTHWTWIQENLIVGAIPFSSHTKDTPGHLKELQEQCARRYCKVSLVISCLELDEGQPFEFASPKDWDSVTGSNSFISVPLPKDPTKHIPKSLVQDVITACAQISAISHSNLRTNQGNANASSSPVGARVLSSTSATFGNPSVSSPGNTSTNDFGGLPGSTRAPNGGSFGSVKEAQGGEIINNNDSGNNGNAFASPNRSGGIGGALRRFTQANGPRPERKKVAYIHCKAGSQRCYIVAACYLMSQHGRSFEDTDKYLRLVRPSFRPSPQQVEFVKSFGDYIAKPLILQPRSDDEELYQKVLADVLSLAPRDRQRLLKDLEKLT